MKIALFTWEYPPWLVGGLGTYAAYLTQEIAKAGESLTVYAANPGSLLEHYQEQGIPVVRPRSFDASATFPYVMANEPQSWGGFFNHLYITNLLWVDRFLQRREAGDSPDLLSIQDWLAAPAGLVLVKQTQLPTVFHVHSAEWGRRHDGGSPMVQHWEGQMAAQADAIITVSHAMKEDLVAHGWPAHKIYVVWNGVDPERYDPARVPVARRQEVRRRYGIDETEVMALFVGRLVSVKGVHTIIRALPGVLAQHPKLKVVILGQGEEEGVLRQEIERLGLESHCLLRAEWVDEEERIAHYAAADLCLFPSTYEPFGIVCLEAMAMAKPVIVGARGVVGFREQVVPEGPDQTGLHINGADPADLAWALDIMLRSRDRREEWGVRGRKRVLAHFTWRAACERTLAIYWQVLQARAWQLTGQRP
jgi:glycogen(starch) synthase